LLSKGTAVTLSPCLFCIDYFNNRELLSRKIILEKIPFFILSLIFGIVAVFAQESGDAIRENGHLFYIERIAVAGYGFLQYIIKLLYPYQLATYYPYPVKPGELLPAIFYISAALSLIVVGVYYFLYRKNKIMIFGALFFLANISIVLQLLPVGDAIMADRYVYIPSIGFFLIIAYSFYNLLLNNSKIKYYLWVAFIGYAIILSIKTKNQIKIWENSLTLWEDAIKKYPNNNDRGYLNRGNIYYDRGEYSIAENDYNKVLEIDSLNNGALIGMGLISQANLELKKSLRYFDKAIQKEKTYEGFMNRAALKICFPDYEGALSDLKEAFKINPYRTGVFNNRGVIFLNTGKYTEALENFNHALILDPESYHALLGIGRVNQALGNPNEALDALNKALLTKQTYEAYSIRADIKMLLRDFNGAREDFYNAMTINPLNAEAYISRGILEISTGNVDLAFQYYDKAIELNPNNSQAYMYRGIAKIDNGDFKGAVCDLDISLQLSYNSISLYYRGLAHAKAGFKNKACSDFNKSFEMGNAQAKIELDKFCGK
jgi:tetratricopeptide (TPR) repeat protein